MCAWNIPSLLLKEGLICYVIVVFPEHRGYCTESSSMRQAPVSIMFLFFSFFFSVIQISVLTNQFALSEDVRLFSRLRELHMTHLEGCEG